MSKCSKLCHQSCPIMSSHITVPFISKRMVMSIFMFETFSAVMSCHVIVSFKSQRVTMRKMLKTLASVMSCYVMCHSYRRE